MCVEKSHCEILLRPFTREEVPLYGQWMSDPEVLGPYVEPDRTPVEQLLADFDRDAWQSNRLHRWLIHGLDGTLMGFAHCWEFDPYETHVEFGRVLLPQYRGRGLGAPLLRLLLNRIFQDTRTDRAQSVTAYDNIAVQNNWKRVGLTVEARLRDYMKLHGSYVDCYLASMLRREWLSS